MFSIKSSRTRLKPPQVLVCSLLCLLAISMILLIAQLRAIELRPNQTIELLQKKKNLTNIHKKQDLEQDRPPIAIKPTATTTEITNGTENIAPPVVAAVAPSDYGSLGRDDRHGTTTETNSQSAESTASVGSQLADSSLGLDLLANEPAASVSSPILAINVGGAPNNLTPITVEGVDRVPEALPAGLGGGRDQLMRQAAKQLIENLGSRPEQGPLLGSNSNEPSLAELTAAGTAAGLFMHDLMAQANMIEQLPLGQQPEAWPSSHDRSQMEANNYDRDEPLEEGQAELAQGLDEQPMPAEQGKRQTGDEDGDIRGGQLDGRAPASSLEGDLAEDQAIVGRSVPLQARQTASRAASLDSDNGAPEPPSENQTPDSIESLMGAELGSYADEPEEGPQGREQSSSDENEGQQDQQLPVGSHVYAQNSNNPTLFQQQQQQQLVAANDGSVNGAQDSRSGRETDDEDDAAADDAVDDDIGQVQQASATNAFQSTNSQIDRRLYAMPQQGTRSPAFQAQPIMVGTNGFISGGSPIVGSGFEQNLVAPMRDSLNDLNAAAGHSYGKKKKKKILKVKKKKIVTKKKKKIKYKKYKVIKIKKKKKKKKKKKYHKKVKHHKKPHHDHGKYYMYAKVPKKKSWEFGFKKGNKKHWVSRHEKGHKNKFKTKVEWYDKKSKGKGIHIWDYNHHDKKKKKHY